MFKNGFYCMVLLFSSFTTFALSKDIDDKEIQRIVAQNITPLMDDEKIAGMAVAVIYQGKPHYATFGLADIEQQIPIDNQTLFEIGSVSKTFTGVLAGDSIARGQIQLNNPAAKHWPLLTGNQWQAINLLHLATYTAGGLPLQIPDEVTDQTTLLDYYNQWQPEWPAGTKRMYGNASLGLFGIIVAQALEMPFEDAMTHRILEPLQLSHTWINVPETELAHYAWGYREDKAVRVSPAPLADEAYGIKTTIEDLAKWMQVNMNPHLVKDPLLQKGIELATMRYYQLGTMFQGLGWELYDLPLDEAMVMANSDNQLALATRDVTELMPPQQNKPLSWVHKTGATGGFGAYLAFIPEKQLGIVILANKNYPNPKRVETAFKILNALQ